MATRDFGERTDLHVGIFLMDKRRYSWLILLISLISLLAFGSAGGRGAKFVPTYLIQDAHLGLTLWGPAGFLPNPDKAADEGARMHWYGTAPDFDQWGFFTFYRTGPVTGLDPTYFVEELQRKWGEPAVPARPIALADGEGQIHTFHRTEKGVKWAIHSVLVAAGDGALDLTVFAPHAERRDLVRFVTAFAATLRVRPGHDSRTYTLAAGFSFALGSRWLPEAGAPAGKLFRAYRFDRNYRLDLALAPANIESAAYIRSALGAGPERAVVVETSTVPAGRLLVARAPDVKGRLLAVLEVKDTRLVLDAVLPVKAGPERLLAVARSVTPAPALETDERILQLARELRRGARTPGPALRRTLEALTPFAGHPRAREALLPLLTSRREDVIVEAALQGCEMAPFGPQSDVLRPALQRALKHEHQRAAAVLVLALGRTGDPSLVADLQPLLSGKHLGVACAATDALGHIEFGDGEAAEALIELYETLARSGRGARASYRGGAPTALRNKALYFPVVAALRRQSGRDFPLPDGPRAARRWLEERRREKGRNPRPAD